MSSCSASMAAAQTAAPAFAHSPAKSSAKRPRGLQNLRPGLGRSFSAVSEAATQCLDQAGLGRRNLARVVACLALAGASEPAHLAAACAHKHPFCKTLITTDAHAACIGAHGNRDGAIIVAGTGTIGWAVLKGQSYRVGGWGLPISDDGSGAWLGCEALRRVLWAFDGRIAWTPLLRALFAHFGDDPHAIVRWTCRRRRRATSDYSHRAFSIMPGAAIGRRRIDGPCRGSYRRSRLPAYFGRCHPIGTGWRLCAVPQTAAPGVSQIAPR